MQTNALNTDSMFLQPRLANYKSLLDPRKILRSPMLQTQIQWIFPDKNNPYHQRKIPRHFKGQIVILRAIIPKSSPFLQGQQREPSESPYTSFTCRIRPVDLIDYVRHKGNQNISFTGASQHGKSYLTPYFLKNFNDQQRIIFSFKPNDHALRIEGIERKDARKHLPPKFEDSDAFAQAYFTTFFDEKTSMGIQLQPTTAILKLLAEKTQATEKQDWETFLEVLKKEHKQSSKNDQATLEAIHRNVQQLVIPQMTSEPIDYQRSIALDFSTISNTIARNFYAELVLRQLWNDLSFQRRKFVTIVIDEAHRLIKKPFSIVHTVSREIGHVGRLWIITQNVTDIYADSRTNFATKFAFKLGKEDLDWAKGIDPILQDALSRLQKYEFLDIEFPRFHEYVPVFHYATLQEKTIELAPAPAGPQAVETKQGKGEGGGSAEGEEEPQEKRGPKIVIDEQEVKALLPDYWTPIIKKVVKQHRDLDFNDLKFSVSQILKRIDAGHIDLDEEQDQPSHSFYYLRGENVSQLHNYIQLQAKKALGRLYKLKHEASSGELSNPDLEYVNEKDEPILDVEVETGLSNANLKRLKERIERALGSDKKVIVIVPNEDQSAKYTKYLLEFIIKYQGRISILTLRELKDWVREVKTGERAESSSESQELSQKERQGETETQSDVNNEQSQSK